MDDFVIDACRWHVDCESKKRRQGALDHFRECYGVLLPFLREEDLLSDPKFGVDVNDWYSFEIRKSDLTDEGFKLFRLCHGSWNPSLGQGNTQRHLVQWRRKLASLRGDTP